MQLLIPCFVLNMSKTYRILSFSFLQAVDLRTSVVPRPQVTSEPNKSLAMYRPAWVRVIRFLVSSV